MSNHQKRRAVSVLSAALLALVTGACQAPADDAGQADGDGALEEAQASDHVNGVLNLWEAGLPVFGVYVPSEGPAWDRASGEPRPDPVYTAAGGATLAANPLYDYVFLNLEGAYDPAAAAAIAEGLARDEAEHRKTLLVRIPPLHEDGEEVTQQRIAELTAVPVDGLIMPHVRTLEEAETIIAMVNATGVDVWSPQNPDGEFVLMLMLEDPNALAQVQEFADMGGYSMLSCGIGSLTRALDGDREAAHQGAMDVLAHANRAGLTSMMTASPDNIDQRMDEGFHGILTMGPDADDVIRRGRELAGR